MPSLRIMQPSASMWLYADEADAVDAVDAGLRTPKFSAGYRRILNDADADPSAPPPPPSSSYRQSPSEAKRARHFHHEHHLTVAPSAGEIPLRQRVHDLPRPQIHQSHSHFHQGYSHGHHQQLLPPLSVSSISPPNSSRPLIGLAPLRAAPRRCRQLGCGHTAKNHDLCPDHYHQHYQQQQQQQYHMARQYASSPSQSVPPAMRPTLPSVRYEFSIPSMLSPPSPPQRHLSPFSNLSLHHHVRSGAPLLPALRSVGLPVDSHVVSPVSYTVPSPASSTSSYSSYGHSSEASAAVPTPTAASSSTGGGHRNETPPPAMSVRASTSVNSSSATKPATKCRREHCTNAARRKGLCMEHGGRHFCKMDGCSKCAHRGGFCISHGGGRRCAVANCTKSAQSGGICYSHGGGKRCATDGCTHAARSGGFCIKHGKQQLGHHHHQEQ